MDSPLASLEAADAPESSSRLSYSRMNPEDAEAAFQRRKEELRQRFKEKVPTSSVSVPRTALNCYRNITETFTKASEIVGNEAIAQRKVSKNQPRASECGVALFERQVEWKQKATEKADCMRKMQSEKEMEGCTFNPRLKKPVGPHVKYLQFNPQGKVHERAELWAKEKQRKTEEMKEIESERELQDCTFHPQVKSQSKTFDSSAYFQRQLSWKREVSHKIAVLEAKVNPPKPSKPPTSQNQRPPSPLPKQVRLEKLQQALSVLEDRVNSSLGVEAEYK